MEEQNDKFLIEESKKLTHNLLESGMSINHTNKFVKNYQKFYLFTKKENYKLSQSLTEEQYCMMIYMNDFNLFPKILLDK
tara:strand:+ start:81 stop:320 length:240 start_codon:yes stop_codon:yes gene_type:complete